MSKVKQTTISQNELEELQALVITMKRLVTEKYSHVEQYVPYQLLNEISKLETKVNFEIENLYN